MATIGLKNLHYSRRTVTQSNGVVSAVAFATPVRVPGAISANVDVETADAVLDADDGTLYDLHPFKRGTITLNVDDLPVEFIKDTRNAPGRCIRYHRVCSRRSAE